MAQVQCPNCSGYKTNPSGCAFYAFIVLGIAGACAGLSILPPVYFALIGRGGPLLDLIGETLFFGTIAGALIAAAVFVGRRWVGWACELCGYRWRLG